jgi:hypothetical protein
MTAFEAHHVKHRGHLRELWEEPEIGRDESIEKGYDKYQGG